MGVVSFRALAHVGCRGRAIAASRTSRAAASEQRAPVAPRPSSRNVLRGLRQALSLRPRCALRAALVRALQLRKVMRTIGRTGILTLSIVAALVLLGGSCMLTYNKLVRLDEAAKSQWAQVENTYQRRADLIPNLVETVKGAAAFERDTLTAVTQARARVGQVAAAERGDITSKPEAFRARQQAEDALGGAVSRLLVVAEAYPNLTATQGFRDLQAQLEGTENRITVERMRFNDAARAFNTARASFPTSLVAGIFGGRFTEKQYFAARAGSDVPPQVRF
jgi:LemA protein